jgi:crotonobetainyl-CoA:carnitine CoA-transferase CaiB-like acyl-CoA transferase
MSVTAGFVQYATDSELGDVPHIRTPVKIDGSIRVRVAAPKLGQNNAEIFHRIRLSEQDIERLQAQRVVWTRRARAERRAVPRNWREARASQ